MELKVFESIATHSEANRLKAKKKQGIFLALGIPFLVAGIVAGVLIAVFDLMESSPNLALALIVVALLLIVAGIVILFLAANNKKKYQKSVLSSVQEAVENALYTDIKRNSKGCLPLEQILRPGFYAKPDRYIGSNYVSAAYNGISFEYADFDLQRREEHRDSKGNVTVSYVSYASGRMFRFFFERNFEKDLMIVEKTFLSTPKDKGLEKIETEFLEFNKKFAVYSSDDQFVFYILTPQVQEKILELEKMNGGKGQFYYRLMNNQIYVSLCNGVSFPKPSLWKPLDVEIIKTLAEQFAMPASMIDRLELAKNKYKENAGVK